MRRSSSTISPEPYDTFQVNRAAAAVPSHPEFTPTTSASPAGATTRSAMPSRSPPPWEGGGHVKVRELVDAMRLPADYTPRWLGRYAAVRKQALRGGALPQTHARRCRAHPSNSMSRSMYQRAFLRSSTSPLSRQPASYVLDHVAIVERQRVGLDVLDGAGCSASSSGPRRSLAVRASDRKSSGWPVRAAGCRHRSPAAAPRSRHHR